MKRGRFLRYTETYMKHSLLMIMFALFCACAPKTAEETEPNDSAIQANEIGISSAVKGRLATSEDRDYYFFENQNDSGFSVSVSAVKGVNIAFAVYSDSASGPVLIKYADDARKSSPEKLSNIYLPKGKYYIAVTHGERDEKKGSTADSYILSVVPSDGSVTEREPNDFFETAQRVEFESEITGYFSPSFNKLNEDKIRRFREDDIFVFSAEASAENPAVIEAAVSGVRGVNSVMELCSAQGDILASADSQSEGSGEIISGFGIMQSGDYYIRIYSKSMTENPSEPYKFTLNKTEYSGNSELEPNDSADSANKIADGISGVIYPGTDTDFFYCSTSSDSQYSAEISSQGKIRALVYDKDMRKMYQEEISDGDFVFPNILTDGGFYLSLSSPAASAVQYSVKLSGSARSAEYEKEPNDSMKISSTAGSSLRGYFSHSGDKDYFRFSVKERVKASFRIKGIQSAEMTVSVTDSLGFKVRSENVKMGGEAKFTEMIDKNGFLLIEFSGKVSSEEYVVETDFAG